MKIACNQSFLTLAQLKQHQKTVRVHDTIGTPKKDQVFDSGEEPDPNEMKQKESIYLEPQEPNLRKVHQTSQNHFEYQTRPESKVEPSGAKNISQLDALLSEGSLGNQFLLQSNMFKSNVVPSFPAVTDLSGVTDQATLLKRINKIIDENISLKKNLEIYKQLLEFYQFKLMSPLSSHLQGDQTTSTH